MSNQEECTITHYQTCTYYFFIILPRRRGSQGTKTQAKKVTIPVDLSTIMIVLMHDANAGTDWTAA